MPRNGAGIYSTYPGTDGIPNTTIASSPYNINVHDVETDLNLPRPIVAGGTGANNADQALVNLSAEKMAQNVSNYDTHVFVSGSFLSGVTATGAPVTGHNFMGIAYAYDGNNIFIEARDMDSTTVPPVLWIRQRYAGAWRAWAQQNADLAAVYVLKAGDTMTGSLNMTVSVNNTAGYFINNSNSGTAASAGVFFTNSGPLQSSIFMGSTTLAQLGGPSSLNLLTGNAPIAFSTQNTLRGTVSSAGNLIWNLPVFFDDVTIARTAAPTTGAVLFGNAGTKYIFFDGTRFKVVGGAIDVGSPLSAIIGHLNLGGYSPQGITYRPTSNATNAGVFLNTSDAIVGTISCTAAATAYNTSSDMRLKDGIEAFNAGAIVDDIEVFSFRWKSTGERSYGVSAQQASEVFPQAVTHDETLDYWGVDYSKFVPILLEEVKTLRARVAQLESISRPDGVSPPGAAAGKPVS